MEHHLLRYHPDVNNIGWHILDKESYIEIENILTDGVVFFKPFVIDNFYSDEDFEELKYILNKNNLSDVDFTNMMNKWEQSVFLPQKFIDIALEKVKNKIGTDDILNGYSMYAHHQITENGRTPKLFPHIDHSPGSYMIDLHIGGNRDWAFVANNKSFITKPNQAIICQPQFDYHYRPKWGNDDPTEYYQALFIHLINKNHWSIPNDNLIQSRPDDLCKKYNFGQDFRYSKLYQDFSKQRELIFRESYFNEIKNSNLPSICLDEDPRFNQDSNIFNEKNVYPKVKI